MTKVLFIASQHFEYCGGEVCTIRNLNMLKLLYKDENVIEFRISRNNAYKNKFKPLWYLKSFINDIITCSIGGLDITQIKKIKYIIKKENIEYIFIDNSTFGCLAKRLKQEFKQIKICTFFHNVEYLYYKQEYNVQKKKLLKYRLSLLRRNETDACLYSDKIVALNKRDSSIINSFYHRSVDHIIPIGIKNTYNPTSLSTQINTGQRIGIFVGSYFSLNIEGITHFIHHILPHTNIKLIIVGSGMNKLKNQIGSNPSITIYDYTSDLTPFYEQADFAVIPILSGSGMKVKTAEALMYGKYILGTTEAFEGYSINEYIGKECINDEAFINAINTYDRIEKFNRPSRELYLNLYSYEVSFAKFKLIFN